MAVPRAAAAAAAAHESLADPHPRENLGTNE